MVLLGQYLNLRTSRWKQQKPSWLILAIPCSLRIIGGRRIFHRGNVSVVFIPFDQDFISRIRICDQKLVFHLATAEMKTGEGKVSLIQALQYLLVTFLNALYYTTCT